MLFLAPKWWPTISSRGVWPSGRPDSKGERGLRAPGEGCVLLRATATSKAAAAKCRPRRHQSHSAIGSKHRRQRRLHSHRWPLPADGWLKALDFTGQGAGRRSNGVIFSSPTETRQAPNIGTPADGASTRDPFKQVGACEGLSSLRPLEING